MATQIFFIFTPILGEAEPILTSIFFKWVVQPPTREDLLYGLGTLDGILSVLWGPHGLQKTVANCGPRVGGEG